VTGSPLSKLPVFSYEIRVLPQRYDSIKDEPGYTLDDEGAEDDDDSSSSTSSLDSFHSLDGAV
jgi:hypothetical protein